jgi:hypothetical protein
MAMADAAGVHAPAGNTRPSVVARRGRAAGVLRPGPAGRETSQHWGGPIGSWATRQAEAYWHRESPLYVEGEAYRAEDAAVGTAPHTGPGSTEARRPARKRIPDMLARIRMSPPPGGPEQPGRDLAMGRPCADARATEAPEAGTLPVRVGTGGAG